MKIKDIMAIVAVALMTGGCSSDDGLQSGEGRVPITLTASVGTEVTTRGVQETALANGEEVYVWGQEGAGDYGYLKAWTLTANGSGGWQEGYTPQYYPLSGETLTMVALHGNLSYTEGTALPATISHSVEADQSDANAYEKSDLLWATETGSSTNATGKSLVFTHKLSKIEVKLHPGEGYSVSDIASAEVRMRGVLPTITIDPTDGSLGSASGTTILVKARMTENHLEENTPYALYEAIIPPQAAPTAFLNIKIGDKLATVAADVADFASNKRYVYDITIKEFKVDVTSSIASWGSGVNADVTKDKIVEIGRPKLPIEYVADYNMATTSSFATNNYRASSGYFTWEQSKSCNLSNYHLPSVYEWMSVIAPNSTTSEVGSFIDVDGSSNQRIAFKQGQHMDKAETVAWGVTNNNGTYSYEVNRRFYNDYNCPNDGLHDYIGYGLRFKETTGKNGRYTCAYRYEYKEVDTSLDNCASLTVKVKYVGFDQNVTISTISDEGWWATVDFTRVFPACGYYDPSSLAYVNRGTYFSVTNYSTTHASGMNFYDVVITAHTNCQKTCKCSVRLFKDAE
jgi:hypothetical protein